MIINGINYGDQHEEFLLDTNLRKFNIPPYYIIAIEGDNNSQLISLKTPRYYDGVDLSQMTAHIRFKTSWVDELSHKSIGEFPLINEEYYDVAENDITYYWVLDWRQTYKAGVVTFAMCWVSGDYEFNTAPNHFQIGEGLNIDEYKFLSEEAYEAVMQAVDTKMDKFGEVSKIGSDITRVSGISPILQFISNERLDFDSKSASFVESEGVHVFVGGTDAYPITMVNILPESVDMIGYNVNGNTIYYVNMDSTGINFADTPLKSLVQPVTYHDLTNKDYVDNKIASAIDQTYSPTSENAQSGTAVAGAIATKVDKVAGKGLSTNDFTNTLKTKLNGIADGAEVNVQSDWNQTVNTADDYIKNKPTIPTVDQTYSAISENAQSGTAVAQAINQTIGGINAILTTLVSGNVSS